MPEAGYTRYGQGEIDVPKHISRSLTERQLDLSLIVASGLGDLNRVQQLLNAGANPDARDKYHITALHWAAASGHIEVVRLLVAHGADVNAFTLLFGEKPNHWAANEEIDNILSDLQSYKPSHGHQKLKRLFWGLYGFYQYEEQIASNKELSIAVAHLRGRQVLNAINSLIDLIKGANPYIMNRHQVKEGEKLLVVDDAPLHHAILNSNINGVRGLLKHSVPVHFLRRQFELNHSGENAKYQISIQTPLHIVRYKKSTTRDMKILQILLEYDASRNSNVNARDQDGQTPIYQAIRHENIEAINLLLDYKAKVDIADYKGLTPFHVAALTNNSAIISRLLRYKTDSDIENPQQNITSFNGTRNSASIFLLQNNNIKAKQEASQDCSIALVSF